MYKIDVPTYHWDNDYFQIETKTLRFENLKQAEKFQVFLRTCGLGNDSLLCHPSVPRGVRYARTHEIPQHNSLAWMDEYDRLDVYNGVIIESPFDVYTEEVIRHKIGT